MANDRSAHAVVEWLNLMYTSRHSINNSVYVMFYRIYHANIICSGATCNVIAFSVTYTAIKTQDQCVIWHSVGARCNSVVHSCSISIVVLVRPQIKCLRKDPSYENGNKEMGGILCKFFWHELKTMRYFCRYVSINKHDVFMFFICTRYPWKYCILITIWKSFSHWSKDQH